MKGAVPVEVPEEGARLDEWDRLTQAATAGPWSAADEHGLLECAEPAWCVSRMRPGYEAISETEGYLYDIAYTTGTNEQADAEFIAMAREALPALLGEVRRAYPLIAARVRAEERQRVAPMLLELHRIMEDAIVRGGYREGEAEQVERLMDSLAAGSAVPVATPTEPVEPSEQDGQR